MSEIDFNKTGDFSIDGYVIYPSKNLLVDKDGQIQVTPKVMAVLITLAKRQGETVSKDDLMKAVWGDIATSDMVLSKAISELRKALGDTGQKQNKIKTVSKKGYVLVAEVSWTNSNKLTISQEKGYARVWSKIAYAGIGLIFIGLTGFIYHGQYYKPSEGYYTAPIIKNITADAKEQRHPRFSPDGKFVAYFEDSGGDSDKLILHDLQSGIKKELKSFKQKSRTGPSKGISFSGDGEKLAVRINYAKGCQILIIELRSMIEKELKACPFSTIASIDFSPNGNYIVTTEFKTDKRIVNLVKINLETGRSTLAGEKMEQFGGYLFPRFNTAGTKLASISLVAATSSWSIVITDLKTKQHKTVYESERQLNQVVWGEGEQSLYFVSHQGTAPGIWRLSLDSQAVTRVLNSFHEIIDLDYSVATGEFIYSESQYNFSIVHKVKNTENDFEKIPLKLATKNNILPNISPDGETLAYVSRDFGPDRLFLYSMSTNESQLIYSGSPGRIIDISWNPNSRQLMMTQVNDDSSRLIQIDLDSGTFIELGNGNRLSIGRWSTNEGKYWKSFDGEQWSLNEFGQDNLKKNIVKLGLFSNYEVLANNEIFIRRPGFGNNNKIMKITVSEEFGEVKNEELIIADSTLSDWTIIEDKIYYLLWKKKESSLYSLELEGGQVSEIDTIQGEVYNLANVLSISGDAREIFVVVKNKVGKDLLLMSKE